MLVPLANKIWKKEKRKLCFSDHIVQCPFCFTFVQFSTYLTLFFVQVFYKSLQCTFPPSMRYHVIFQLLDCFSWLNLLRCDKYRFDYWTFLFQYVDMFLTRIDGLRRSLMPRWRGACLGLFIVKGYISGLFSYAYALMLMQTNSSLLYILALIGKRISC